ncbi:MAG TPA: adenylate/guanylate cyclase domain-containing protein [Candidatus Methanoperedens sp.]|nr:adenylate/guanylate cyclase domain-containing protein [Candidatus Methanoperedens sp.]
MRAKITATALVAVCSLLAALALARVPAFERFVLKAGDLQRSLFADGHADRRIVLVEVDQASLDHFERDNIPFPWPRSLYDPLLEHCARGGARAVLFDVLFNNRTPWGEETDAEFAGAIGANGRVFLATAFSRGGAGGGSLEERLSLAVEGTPPAALARNAASAPLPSLRAAAAGIGSVTFIPDADGVARRVPLGALFAGRVVPGLAAAPLAAGARTVRFDPGRARLGDLSVPLDADGRLLVRFHGARAAYRRFSAAAVITSAVAAAAGKPPVVSAEVFRDAYVIVGYTAPGLLDLKPTPLDAAAPGFEVHAAVLDNLLNRDFLAAAPTVATAALALAASLSVAAAVLLLPIAGAAAAILATAVAAAGALAAAYRAGPMLDLFTLMAAALLALIGAAVWRYQTEGRQRRFIAGAFSRYVSPKVVRQILEDPKRLALGGERREVTLFFSDLQGFTSISETMGPAELVGFLNEYTTLMADVVTGLDGTIDKYIGDSVMAFWGAPLPQPDHARRALLAALLCQDRLRPFCDGLVARGGPRLVTRIGLNSGVCVVGNMGSRDRFDYTAIGDTVNQASRLEGINKVYGTLIIASDATWRASGGAAFGRPLDRVRVKGKAEPVAIHEVMAVAGAETEAQRTLAAAYAQALAAYQGRRWEEAIALAQAIPSAGDDGPARVLLERARAFFAAPPPPDWDGVWTLTAK